MSLAALMAVALYVVNLWLLLSFHLLDRDRSIVSHAVSDYALGKASRRFQLYGVVGGTAALVMAWLFYQATPAVFGAEVAPLLAIMTAARAGVTLFPTDVDGAPRTTSGIVHSLSALALFACAFAVINQVSGVLAEQSHLPALRPLWPLLRWIIIISVVAMLVTSFKAFRAMFGLAERVFIITSAIWFLLAAIWFLVPKPA